MLKDAVSFPRTSMTYMLNKSLKMNKPGDSNLYTPGQPCDHKCKDNDPRLGAACLGLGCKDSKQVKINCTQCNKNKPYELLKTGMVGGPSIVFCWYAEARKSQTRYHKYQNFKICAIVIEFDVNSLYLYCSGKEMPCGNEKYVKVSNLQDPRVNKNLCDKFLADEYLSSR